MIALPGLTDAFALFSIALVLCAGVLRCVRAWLPAAGWYQALLVVVLLLLLLAWPVGTAQLPLAAYVRGISSDLSISLLLLALLDMAGRMGSKQPRWPVKELGAVAVAVLAAALVVYSLALGLGDWDIYRLGWPGNATPMLLALLLLCAVCVIACRLWLLPLLIMAALLGWSIDLLESGNLWDYLMDPWLVLLCVVCVVVLFKQKGALS